MNPLTSKPKWLNVLESKSLTIKSVLSWIVWLFVSVQSGINYRWSDGGETVYTHWDTADDEDDFVSEVCVYIDVNGGWRTADCRTLLPGALCHVPPTPPSQCLWECGVKSPLSHETRSTSVFFLSLAGSEPYISNKIACPSSWVNFERWCYNFDHVIEKHTFEESSQNCKHLGKGLPR